MSAGWVAGSVRARAMSRHRIGGAAACGLAAHRGLEGAITAVADTAYGRDVRPGQSLATAQRAVVASVLWNLRVLAGWQPPQGVATMRLLLGAVEVTNVREHLEGMQGTERHEPYRLGMLASAWSRLATTTRPAQVRDVLASSVWGDPGGETPYDIALFMRLTLADRVIAAVPAAAAWAAGDAALLVARESVLQGRPLPPRARVVARRVLGATALGSRTLAELRPSLPARSRWAVADVDDPTELWRAEARWWRRVARDGEAMLRSPRSGEGVLVGTVAALAADAWLVRAALEVAAREGHGIEVLDAVA